MTPAATRRSPPWLFDAALAVLATAFILLATAHIEPDAGERAVDGWGYAAIVVAGGSLGLCRRWPWVALVAVTAALSVWIARDYPGGPIYPTAWITLYALGYRTTRRAAFTAAAVVSGILVVAGRLAGSDALLLHLLFIGWSAAAVFLGEAVRSRRTRLVELEERARYLERTREEEARRRVAEERLRIARDLHDSVAHSMATINVQAAAAAHVVERRPEAAKEAFAAIQRASADVLDELAALVGLLRDRDDSGDHNGGAARTPTPGLAEIAGLVDATRDARLSVTLAVEGPIDAVPKPIGTGAYRIVQESLTNVLRHAGNASATVRVAVGDGGGLTVEVVDDGAAPNARGSAALSAAGAGTGTGIQGMRERAEATGGTLDAGPRAGGGFGVRATWPGHA